MGLESDTRPSGARGRGGRRVPTCSKMPSIAFRSSPPYFATLDDLMRTSATEREEETCERRRVRSYARRIAAAAAAAAAVLRGRGRARRQRSPQYSRLAVRTALSARPRPAPPSVDGPFVRGAPLPFSIGCVNRLADVSRVIRDRGSERRRRRHRRRLAIGAILSNEVGTPCARGPTAFEGEIVFAAAASPRR